MTIASISNRKSYAGDGVTLAFSTGVDLVFFDATDLTVYVVTTATGASVTKVLNTDYTVTGGSGASGTVTMMVAPSALETLVIVRTLPLTQGADLVNGDPSDAEVVEDALDKAALVSQQLSAKITRSFVLPDSDVSGASTELPAPTASTILGWNSAGTALQNYVAAALPSSILVSTFMQTMLDDVDAPTARNTLILDKSGTDVTSAASINLTNTTGDFVDIIGTATISTIVLADGMKKIVRFFGPLTLTHGANLVLPGAASVSTANNDMAVFVGDSGSIVRCVSYFRAATGALVTAATTSANGIVTLAAQADANAMTSTTKVLTPNLNKIVLGTEAAGTGTSIDFTGIPSGVRKITVNIVGLSGNGTSNFQVQLGDAGGAEVTGYSGAVGGAEGSTITQANLTAGFLLTTGGTVAAGNYGGQLILSLEDATDFTWTAQWTFARRDAATLYFGCGDKATSAELDRVRITTVNGTDAFDAGVVNISYER